MPESSAERSQLNPQGWVPTSGKNCSTKVKEAENRILRNMKKAFDKGRERKRRYSADHKDAVREAGRRLNKNGTVKSRDREHFQG